MDKRLDLVIEEMLNEKTFNLDAVEAIKSMKDQVKDLEDRKDSLELKFSDLQKTHISLIEQRDTAQTRLVEYEKRESELVEREKEMTRLECEVEKERAVAGAYRDSMSIVFKPHSLRETVLKNTISDWDSRANRSVHTETGHTKETEEA